MSKQLRDEDIHLRIIALSIIHNNYEQGLKLAQNIKDEDMRQAAIEIYIANNALPLLNAMKALLGVEIYTQFEQFVQSDQSDVAQLGEISEASEE